MQVIIVDEWGTYVRLFKIIRKTANEPVVLSTLCIAKIFAKYKKASPMTIVWLRVDYESSAVTN